MGQDDSADKFDLVVWFAPTAPADRDAAMTAVTEAMLLAQRAKPVLERAAGDGRAAFLAVTQFDGAFGLTDVAADEKAILGGVFALVKTLGIESPTLFCRGIDIAVDQGAAALMAELYDPRTELTQVGYSPAGQRRTLEFTENPSSPLIDAPRYPSRIPETYSYSPAAAAESPRPARSRSRNASTAACCYSAAPNSQPNRSGPQAFRTPN
ncbi:hypothetical protein [Nocardia terpenica]|uniref:Uncharacterized protein n=1 Tax=Nocardia terpenica TaxID=455432 RepID=A0A6G9Z5Z3_9NOCA|nr:hypothetical protein F6W96_21120 [Nocardia terpenica]